MPTYEYICEACGAEYELEQRISDEPNKKCKKCGKSKARRQITQGNFILKGGGWYSDLYSSPPPASSSSSTKSSKASTPAPAKTSTKSSGKKDA
ncbi:MAG: zinc ribbon domain-containing protein [Myxococcales bacterium]|nr:MAG: zinc ribbon domain-containing protein [Myxococcales bacterium]